MAELIDYSYDRLTPAEIKAAGKAGVIRYVASGRPQVSATRAEVDAIRAAGLAFVAVWERGPARALSGRTAGEMDGADADAYCAGLGAGPTDRVYFAVDFDASPAQMPAVAAYVEGAASVLGWDRVGVYGGLPVLEYLRARTPLGLFWQTIAWSGGVLLPYANLYQYRIEDVLNGKAVDLDRSLNTYYGQWGVPMPITYPGAAWRPLGAQTQPPMRAHEVICLHTMVGYLASTDTYFRAQGFGGTESHFGVGGQWGSDVGGLDGAVWQWQDLDYTADANLEGNGRVISIETADNAPQSPGDIAAWTPKQLDAIVDLVAWLCRRYDIPARLIPDTKPGTRGIGYHAQGTAANLPAGAERWSTTVGKPCPTARRIAQITGAVIPRVQALLDQGADQPMSAAEVKQILDAVAGVQATANLIYRGDSPVPAGGNTHPNIKDISAAVSSVRAAVGAQANDEQAILAALVALEGRLVTAIEAAPQGPGGGVDAKAAAQAAVAELRDALTRGEPA